MLTKAAGSAVEQLRAIEISIDDIEPSSSAFQVRRRKRFAPAEIQELANSIKSLGLLQPILVRPLGKSKYELVAGERRWLASKKAGLKEILATVRELTDEQAIAAQAVENLQRKDPHPLEEAEAYEQLIALKKKEKDYKGNPVEDVATSIGKSRSYLYLRLQLLTLGDKIRDKFYSGDISVSTAGYLCRVRTPELQLECLEQIQEGIRYDNWTERLIERHIKENYTLELKAAPFDTGDATLCPNAGACGPCPKRTGNSRDLFDFIKSGDVCTDTACFAAKKQAAAVRKAEEIEKKGGKIIKGAAAAGIVRENPHMPGRPQIGGGYASLDEVCHDDPQYRKVRQILGAKSDLVELVQDPKSKQLLEVVDRSKLTDLLNDRGVKTAGQERAKRAKETRKRNEKTAIEEEITRRAICEIYEKHDGKLNAGDLQVLASLVLDCFDNATIPSNERVELALGGKSLGMHTLDARVKKMAPLDVSRLMLLIAMSDDNHVHLVPSIAKRHKVDLAKIRKTYLAELKAGEK